MDTRILIVDDEVALVKTLKDRLNKEGYSTSAAGNSEAALNLATHEQFDLIILDLMLPGEDGLTVCRKLRQLGVHTPILMLTARREVTDKVLGLKLGADDYLTKPFQMRELLARIEALLRRIGRSEGTKSARHQFGGLTIDILRGAVFRDGKEVLLAAKEFELLRYMVEHRGATLPREELLREVWGYDIQNSSRTVDVHIFWLRQKIEEDPQNPQLILTAIGLGYKFADVRS